MDLLQVLHRVVADGDILSGIEDLHPDWLEIFEQSRDRLDSVQNPRLRKMFIVIREAMDDLRRMDSIVGLIDPQKENIAFLLGAGASKPAPSNIPTVAELLKELLERARRLDREQMTDLAEFCDREGINNIEDLLTAVLISELCSRNPSILKLVEHQLLNVSERDRIEDPVAPPVHANVASVAYVQETLQLLFGLLTSLMLPARPNKGHEALVEYIEQNLHTTIVTTNYDCCMDLALIKKGVGFTYDLEFANPSVLPNRPGLPVSLIKLHGSLNWFYCETCQTVRLIDIERVVDDYECDSGEYPIISVCYECGGQRRGLLVPPHAMKFDVASPLQPLILRAADELENKTLITVVGFSFSEADAYIFRMLVKAMQGSNDTKLLIIDPNPEVARRIRNRFNSLIPNFDAEARILMIRGDCAEVLPRFLHGQYLATNLDATENDLNKKEPVAVAAVSN